jgi:ADP-ribose pyrophosphatase YjhB (NUDIX family)
MHSVSVAAAILDDAGRFLVIRRADNGHWEPPGGVLELDESIASGLIREVEEETGLHVRPLALSGVYKNMSRGIVALVFYCDVIGGEAQATAEAREIAWLTPDELTDHMGDAYSVRLLDALNRDAPATVRAHDGTSLVG